MIKYCNLKFGEHEKLIESFIYNTEKINKVMTIYLNTMI